VAKKKENLTTKQCNPPGEFYDPIMHWGVYYLWGLSTWRCINVRWFGRNFCTLDRRSCKKNKQKQHDGHKKSSIKSTIDLCIQKKPREVAPHRWPDDPESFVGAVEGRCQTIFARNGCSNTAQRNSGKCSNMQSKERNIMENIPQKTGQNFYKVGMVNISNK